MTQFSGTYYILNNKKKKMFQQYALNSAGQFWSILDNYDNSYSEILILSCSIDISCYTILNLYWPDDLFMKMDCPS